LRAVGGVSNRARDWTDRHRGRGGPRRRDRARRERLAGRDPGAAPRARAAVKRRGRYGADAGSARSERVDGQRGDLGLVADGPLLPDDSRRPGRVRQERRRARSRWALPRRVRLRRPPRPAHGAITAFTRAGGRRRADRGRLGWSRGQEFGRAAFLRRSRRGGGRAIRAGARGARLLRVGFSGNRVVPSLLAGRILESLVLGSTSGHVAASCAAFRGRFPPEPLRFGGGCWCARRSAAGSGSRTATAGWSGQPAASPNSLLLDSSGR
jgi:hypothetical protein